MMTAFMKRERDRDIVHAAMIMIMAIFSMSMSAQDFKVEKFQDLPNDISAFINPVKDLNDEGCALLKIIATSPDFAFSSPLGIAKRIDKTGEIWLYLPRGSKKITIKHSQWGVLRDYNFPSRLESHKTYELSIKEPIRNLIADKMTPIVTTIRDTLVVTRVDTLVVKPTRKPIPLETDILATAGLGGKATYLTWGVMATIMKRHGGYVHLSSDFRSTGSLKGTCDKTGVIDGNPRYYTGKTRRQAVMATAGAAHRIGAHFVVFEGLGYASTTLAWELAKSEGGGYVKNSNYSSKGITAEAGVMLRLKRICISAAALTIKGTEWYGSLGIGLRFGKTSKK